MTEEFKIVEAMLGNYSYLRLCHIFPFLFVCKHFISDAAYLSV
jgi:hypothetical protein